MVGKGWMLDRRRLLAVVAFGGRKRMKDDPYRSMTNVQVVNYHNGLHYRHIDTMYSVLLRRRVLDRDTVVGQSLRVVP